MPYTKHYNFCSVRYSLFVIVWLSHCLVSIVNCSEWVWRVGCTLVYRPRPTSWLSRPDKFGRGNIIVQRLGHIDKADCLSLLASVCVCLNIVCAGLNSFLICCFPKCGNDSKETLSLSNRTVIGVGLKRPSVAAIVYIWNDFIHIGNALGL